MIRFKDTIFPEYFIDPVTAIITNDKGEVQETSIGSNGRPVFKNMGIHRIQIHTHLGYKKGYDIHHLDENKMNNSLSNLVYLTRGEHAKIHCKEKFKGKHFSDDHKRKLSEAHKDKKLSEEAKRKMSEAHKGKKMDEEAKKKLSEAAKVRNKCRIWINNGVVNKFVKCNEEIPEGFVRGLLKNINRIKIKLWCI